jgi:hypothetical protein
MLREVIIFIALNIGFILMNISTVEARSTAMSRNYLKNVEKTIVNNCNNRAFRLTNNTEVFECIKYKKGDCCNLANFTEFSNIRNECISEYHSEFGKGVLISIAIWVVIITLCAMKPY